MRTLTNYLTVFFVSMLPLIELRGAVPIGVGMGLPWHWTLIVSIIGNCLPIPFIIFFVKSVLTWMRGCNISLFAKIAGKMYEKAEKHRHSVEKYATWGLFLFVAIPLPGTGGWTGALIASLIDMPRKKSLISIFAGIVTAGVIMTLISSGILGFLKWML